MSVYVIRDGQRVAIGNAKELSNGESVIVVGTDIKTINLIPHSNRTTTQLRKNPENREETIEVEVQTASFGFMGRAFAVTGREELPTLLAHLSGKLKGEERVKEVYLIASEWHSQLKDADGNLVWEDGDAQTIPALNTEKVNYSFTFSGLATAADVVAELDDELSEQTKREKVKLMGEAQKMELMAKYGVKVPAEG